MNTPQGFNTSSRRLFVEVGVIVLALLLLGLGVWLGVGFAVSRLMKSPPLDTERKLGEAVWQTAVPAEQRCVNKRTLQYVGDVLRPLLAQQPSGFRFAYAVSEDASVNALSLPGGFITVNMGLLAAVENSEELAGVLAHELAHVTEHHGTQRIATHLGTFAVLGWLFGDTSLSAVASIAGELATMAYGRDQEREADAVGLRTLQAAHIDPRGMATLFERLSREQSTSATLFASHPDPGERASAARSAPAPPELRPLPQLPEGLRCH